MRFLDRFARGEMRLARVEALSDGVFAIVVTLLVLELKVPVLREHGSAGGLAHQLRELLPKFLSWLISFVIVCKFWLNHHHVLAKARHANYALVWLNSVFLMSQAFVPFPTALLGEYPENPLAVSVFGAVMAANTVVFIALAARDPQAARKALVGPASYLAGAASAWLSVHLAFLFYLVTPLFYIVPPEGRPVPPTSASST
jgi:uncharacterized membrane protein